MVKLSATNHKHLVLGLFFTTLSFLSYGQNLNSQKQLQYGGGLGLSFGNDMFSLSVTPSAIYPVTESFYTGAGLSINYSKFNNASLLAYGGSLLTFYYPIPAIQLSGELEQLRVNKKWEYTDTTEKDNYWSPALFIGAGYSTSNITVGLKYNLLHKEDKSIYIDPLVPFVRVYF